MAPIIPKRGSVALHSKSESEIDDLESVRAISRTLGATSVELQLPGMEGVLDAASMRSSPHYPLWSLLFDWQNLPSSAFVDRIPNVVSAPPYFNKEEVRSFLNVLPQI